MQEEPQSMKRKRGGDVKVAPPGFYTARQARERLGLNESTFHYYVNQGKIKKYIPPLKSNGFYSKKEINQLATELALFFHTHEEEEPQTTTRVAQPEDAQGVVDVLTKGFGWKTAEAWQRLAWYEVNPYIDYIVIHEGTIAGYIHAVPYRSEILEDMMAGRKRSWDITPADILPYRKNKQYHLYIGAAVRQDLPNHTILAFRLIAGFLSFLEELAAQGIMIKSMHAASAEPDGQRLCKALGFLEQPPREGDLWVDGVRLMKRYVLDLETSDSHFAVQYREAIKKGD